MAKGYVLSESDKNKISSTIKKVDRLSRSRGRNAPRKHSEAFIYVEVSSNANNVYTGTLQASNKDGTFSAVSPSKTINNIYSFDDSASDLTGQIIQAFIIGESVYGFHPPVPTRTGLDTSKKYALIDKYESEYWIREWVEVGDCG